MHDAIFTNKFKGRGNIKTKRRTFVPIDVFDRVIRYPEQFYANYLLTVQEFIELTNVIQINNTIQEKIHSISFQNKSLMILKRMKENACFSDIAEKFGISTPFCHHIIEEMVQIFYNYFIQWIPNQKIPENETHSVLSQKIKFIVDGTTTQVQRRYPQNKYYRTDKGFHFINNIILCDYDGYIISVVTNICGSLNDNFAFQNNLIFHNILEESQTYAISDSGFGNCSRVCHGYKKEYLGKRKNESDDTESRKRKYWDKHSRSEEKKNRMDQQ